MKTRTLSIFAVVTLFVCLTYTREVKRADEDKVRQVIEAVEYGEKKLEEFRKKNPTKKHRPHRGGGISHGIPQKGDRSDQLEADAIIRIQATKRLQQLTDMTIPELIEDPVISAAFTELTCPSGDPVTCPQTEYRTMDGSCNNVENPTWGQSFTTQSRYIPPTYGPDDTPRTSPNLPSARAISNDVFKATENVPNPVYSGLIMAWGQLIDHDLVHTPSAGSLDCCDAANADNPICFPIEVPANDDTFSTCLTFVRSAEATSTESCLSDQREHINELTSFVDGGMLYGSSDDEVTELKDDVSPYLLKTKEPGNLLPPTDDGCVLSGQDDTDYCQLAGDSRVNVIPTLGSMHTLLVREHNRIAAQLKTINANWDDDKIFQETRKIMGALIQHITYNEWLPRVVGTTAYDLFDLRSSDSGHANVYDPKVDPSIRNAFAAAALRYGHTLIMPTQSYLDNQYTNQEDFSLETQQLDPHMVVQQNGGRLDDLVRWTSYKPAQNSDRMFEDGIRNHLFGISDLPARNVQRGRDHGLPPYNQFRVFCGLSEVKNFGTGRDGLTNHTSENAQLLDQMYSSVNDIDLFVGAITERTVGGGEVGPTFACLIGKQFEALKKGDSFWYELSGIKGFSPEKLDAIKRVGMGGLLCQHFSLDTIQPDPFRIERAGRCPGSTDRGDNCMLSCSERRFRVLDLSLWREDSAPPTTQAPTQAPTQRPPRPGPGDGNGGNDGRPRPPPRGRN